MDGGERNLSRLQRDVIGSVNSQQSSVPLALLVLVGLPGSGKSTFSNSLISQSSQKWVAINQDSIRNGRPGTRQQCMSAASRAFRRGSNVVIDRSNVTPEQRQSFIQIAKECGVQRTFCVMLRLPATVCGSRAAVRTHHDAGVQGPRAYAVVGMMHKQLMDAGDPKLKEGFDSILVCENDEEIAAALSAVVAYGGESTDLLQLWERVRPDNNNNNKKKKTEEVKTIDSFFNKGSTVLANTTRFGRDAAARTSSLDVEANLKAPTRENNPATSPTSVGRDAFKVLMESAKHAQHDQATGRMETKMESRHTNFDSPFRNALLKYVQSPETFYANDPDNVIFDAHCIVVPDMYPKATIHGLVIARDQRLKGPRDLRTPQDIPLVRHMQHMGKRWVAKQRAPPPGSNVVMGFHSVPSLRQLHMHVVSTDYDSSCLKHKKHWNSFTTLFFMDVDTVLTQLEAKAGSPGGAFLDYNVDAREALLRVPLRCHRCGERQASMPKLKQHITTCINKIHHAF